MVGQHLQHKGLVGEDFFGRQTILLEEFGEGLVRGGEERELLRDVLGGVREPAGLGRRPQRRVSVSDDLAPRKGGVCVDTVLHPLVVPPLHLGLGHRGGVVAHVNHSDAVGHRLVGRGGRVRELCPRGEERAREDR